MWLLLSCATRSMEAMDVPLISWSLSVGCKYVLICKWVRNTILQKCQGFSGAKKVNLAPELFKSCFYMQIIMKADCRHQWERKSHLKPLSLKTFLLLKVIFLKFFSLQFVLKKNSYYYPEANKRIHTALFY